MRSRERTIHFYQHQLGFRLISDYGDYLMFGTDGIELHFFLHTDLLPAENYGQVYIRTDTITALYDELGQKQVAIHPNGALEAKPWGQLEFSLLDPDYNLLTFGQSL